MSHLVECNTCHVQTHKRDHQWLDMAVKRHDGMSFLTDVVELHYCPKCAPAILPLLNGPLPIAGTTSDAPSPPPNPDHPRWFQKLLSGG